MRATCTPNFSASRAAASHSVHSCDMKMDCGALSSSSSRSSQDRKSTRLNSSHITTSYAVFCLKENKILCFMDQPCQTQALAVKNSLVVFLTDLRESLTATLKADFFFNDTATTETYTLSLHDALPICRRPASRPAVRRHRAGSTPRTGAGRGRSEEHTSELQSHHDLVCRLLLEKKKKKKKKHKKKKKTIRIVQ